MSWWYLLGELRYVTLQRFEDTYSWRGDFRVIIYFHGTSIYLHLGLKSLLYLDH